MNYRTETVMRCSRPVLDENPLVALFHAIEREQSEPGLRLCCVHCQTAITTERDKTEICSCHLHRLTNPAGLEFNVACFKEAWGCTTHGDASDMHTWFAGFCWQYASCLGCAAHLGWYYTSGQEERGNAGYFYGLIADKLLPVADQR